MFWNRKPRKNSDVLPVDALMVDEIIALECRIENLEFDKSVLTKRLSDYGSICDELEIIISGQREIVHTRDNVWWFSSERKALMHDYHWKDKSVKAVMMALDKLKTETQDNE